MSDKLSSHLILMVSNVMHREIIDESDVYIDVQKGLRRTHQAPKYRVPKGAIVTDPDDTIADAPEDLIDLGEDNKDPREAMRRHATHTGRVNGNEIGAPQKVQGLRRTSSTAYSSAGDSTQKRVKPSLQDQWKNLGPSNPASRPKQTRYNTVKIKPGAGSLSENLNKTANNTPRQSVAAQGGVGAGLVSSAGKDAKDGVLAVQAGYGSIHSGSPPSPKVPRKSSLVPSQHTGDDRPRVRRDSSPEENRPKSKHRSRAASQSTLGSMHSGIRSPNNRNRGTTRSGSITEQIVDAGGIRKTVLEMTSSSDDRDQEEGGAGLRGGSGPSNGNGAERKENDKPDGSGKKKRRRKRRPATKASENEETPLLSNGH